MVSGPVRCCCITPALSKSTQMEESRCHIKSVHRAALYREAHVPNHRKHVEIGAEYGSWTVLRLSNRKSPDGVTRIYYDCKCRCGAECPVRGEVLRNSSYGKDRSCRACGSKRTAKKLSISISPGATFGKWKVIGLSEFRSKSDHGIYYECECRCGTIVPVRGSNLAGGHSTQCQKCVLAVMQAGRDNPLKLSSKRRRPYESVFNTARDIARNGSPSRGCLEWTLEFDDFLRIIEIGKCHYCWTTLVWAKYRGKRWKHGNSYQLDRKDSEIGYTRDNVVPCCKRCNYGKGARFSYEEWFGMARHLRQKIRRKDHVSSWATKLQLELPELTSI